MDRLEKAGVDPAADRNGERELLQKYRALAVQEGVADDIAGIPHVSEAERVTRRRSMRMLRAYAAHLFSNLAPGMRACESAFVLLDADGCIVQIRAAEGFRETLARKGIILGAVWRTDVTGADAVSVGNRERRFMQSAGQENYLPLLQDLALYYAPLQFMERGLHKDVGGVAWICPLESQSDAFMLLAGSLAGALNIRVRTAWNTSDSYEGDPRGVLQLDINTRNGAVSVTHHNRRIFEMLEIPEIDRWSCYFKPAEELLDPPPANERLWKIIEDQQEVNEREITIQSQGRRLNRVITTVATAHPELKSNGIQLFVTTRKEITHQVADRTGNNALISFHDIIGNSPVMKNRIKRARMLANTDSNIMILGESGVGKDVFAQAIHNQSRRRGGPFVSVNCGALPRDLIASELFGYDGGAFTGAKKQGNIGKFELAEGGTLFLDEIGEMPLDLQATLLRAVEQKQFMRLGSSKVVYADVRIISATNVDIGRMIREKRFRADLYYRLSTMSMDIPPLRERGDDAILLAESFIRRLSRKIGRQDIMELTPEAEDFLRRCPWMGNVRELQNLMDCLVQLYPDHQITLDLIRENVSPSYFRTESAGWQDQAWNYAPERSYPVGRASFEDPVPLAPQAEGRQYGQGGHRPGGAAVPAVPVQDASGLTQSGAPAAPGTTPPVTSFGPGTTPPAAPAALPMPEESPAVEGASASGADSRRDLALLTKEEILEALEACEGNRSKAAKYLSVGRRTLYRYIDRFGIGDKQYNK